MLLIINADDLGASTRINGAAFELMDRGLVSSATVMANGPAFEDAVQGMQHRKWCSFGVHLNISQFEPLTDWTAFEDLLDAEGCLTRQVMEETGRPGMLPAILAELTAQVQRVADAGIPISHFDSHHHVHTMPALFPVMKALQQRFHVRRFRSTINLLPPGERMTLRRRTRKAVFSAALHHVYRTRTTEGLGDFSSFHKCLSHGQPPEYETLELMVHPGTASERYRKEEESLSTPWLRECRTPFRIGNYYDL